MYDTYYEESACPSCGDVQDMGPGQYCDYCWSAAAREEALEEDATPRFCDICKMGSGWPPPLNHTEDCPRRAH
jgi:hypothetical protein